MFSYETLSPSRKVFVDAIFKHYPDISNTITRDQIKYVMGQESLSHPQWLTMSDNKVGRNLFNMPNMNSVKEPIIEETDEEVSIRIRDTYESMASLVEAVSANVVNSLIISGAPGIGKSHTVNKILQKVNGSDYGFVFHKGYLRASHLFRLLWENRYKGMTVVIDDCDSIFSDETALNILKSALELKETRRIGWGSEKEFLSEDGEVIPRYFDFEGSVIFLTNKDIRGEISSNSKNAPHLSALESRSLLLDMKIKTKREYMIKIQQTVESGMLKDKGFTKEEQDSIMEFVSDNKDKFTELSLRMVEKVAALYRSNPNNWEKLVRSVCFK